MNEFETRNLIRIMYAMVLSMICFFIFGIVAVFSVINVQNQKIKNLESQVKVVTTKVSVTRQILDEEEKYTESRLDIVNQEIESIKADQKTLDDFMHLKHW